MVLFKKINADKTDVVDLSSTQTVRGNKTFMNACYVNTTPTNGKGIANKEYVDTELALKASLVDGKLDVPNNGGIKTTQNIELLSTSLNKQNIVKIVSSRNGSGYRNWTSLEFIDRDGTTDTKKASLEYRPEGLYSTGCALVPNSDDCWTSKKYVDDAIKAALKPYEIKMKK